MDFLRFTFTSIWHFLGIIILIAMPIKLIAFMWNRFMRHLNIKANGYPPPHCDGDGDLNEETS